MKYKIIRIILALTLFFFALFYSKISKYLPAFNIDKNIVMICFDIFIMVLLIFDYMKNRFGKVRFIFNVLMSLIYFVTEAILFSSNMLFNFNYQIFTIVLGLIFSIYGIYIRENRLSSMIFFIFGVGNLTLGIYQAFFSHV